MIWRHTLLLSFILLKPTHSLQSLYYAEKLTVLTRTRLPVTTTANSMSTSSDGNKNNRIDDKDIEVMKSQAEQLRQEIEIFEEKKRRNNEIYEQQQNIILQQQQKLQDRYSTMVPILKPDGTTIVERCTFTPIYTDGTSYMTNIESNLPLGILIGEAVVTSSDTPNDGNNDNTDTTRRPIPYISIDEIAPNSYGATNGLLVGDIIHACTACKVDMELPTWQLLLGGIGRPKTNRYMHSVGNNPGVSSSSLLETTMEAIASNRFDPEQRPILLVIERREIS